jgi:gliding motility-associated lipoprotein GldH
MNCIWRFKSIFFFASFIVLIALNSCNSQSFYDHNEETPASWNSDDSLHFYFEVTDTINPYNMYINIRNTTDYEYSNIYFFMQIHFPDGRKAIDTLEVFLADRKGNWLGDGMGKNKDRQVLFRKRGRFPMNGDYRIDIEQAMRTEQLSGIKSVGIRIERTQ